MLVTGSNAGGPDSRGPEPEQQAVTEASTVAGQVAATTRLFFQLQVRSLLARPELRLDTTATLLDVVVRVSALVRAESLTDAQGQDVLVELRTVVERTMAPDELRSLAITALAGGDRAAREELVRRVLARQAADPGPGVLDTITTELIGPREPDLALGLLEQLRQVAAGG